MISSRMFVKCTSVIHSCATPGQIESAIDYISLAEKRNHITQNEWLFLLRYCENQMTLLIDMYEILKES